MAMKVNGWTKAGHVLILIGTVLIILAGAFAILVGLNVLASNILPQQVQGGVTWGLDVLVAGIVTVVIGVLVAALELEKFPEAIQSIVGTAFVRGIVMLIIAIVTPSAFFLAGLLIGLGGILYIVGHFL